MVVTILLGQASDHGLVVVEKTKTTDNPSGFAWKALDATKEKSKPSNATAEIALENNLDDIKFGLAKKYYNSVIAVTARYDVAISETNLIKKLAKMIDNTVYAKLVIDHLSLYCRVDTMTVCERNNPHTRTYIITVLYNCFPPVPNFAQDILNINLTSGIAQFHD